VDELHAGAGRAASAQERVPRLAGAELRLDRVQHDLVVRAADLIPVGDGAVDVDPLQLLLGQAEARRAGAGAGLVVHVRGGRLRHARERLPGQTVSREGDVVQARARAAVRGARLARVVDVRHAGQRLLAQLADPRAATDRGGLADAVVRIVLGGD